MSEAAKFVFDYNKDIANNYKLHSIGTSLRTSYQAYLYRYEKTNTRIETVWIFKDESEITVTQYGTGPNNTISVRV